MIIAFYVLGFVAIWSSLKVVLSTNPVHAVLSMIVLLLAVACLFFMLGAAFAGILQMIVYAGAILVLFVFVIMMLNLGNDGEKAWLSAEAWATPFGLSLVVVTVLIGFIVMQNTAQPLVLSNVAVPVKAVGVSLFGAYMLLVPVAGFLLLGALVAAYHLGKKALDDENTSHFQQKR